jgi:hypothetical protein
MSCAWAVALLVPVLLSASEPPPPVIDRPIVDTGDFLSARDEERLGAELAKLSSRETAVLLIDSSGDEALDDFAWRASDAWRAGKWSRADEDPAVLLVVAVKDRRMYLVPRPGSAPRLSGRVVRPLLEKHRIPLEQGYLAEALLGVVQDVRLRLWVSRPVNGVFIGVFFLSLGAALLLHAALEGWDRPGWRRRLLEVGSMLALLHLIFLSAFSHPDISGVEALLLYAGFFAVFLLGARVALRNQTLGLTLAGCPFCCFLLQGSLVTSYELVDVLLPGGLYTLLCFAVLGGVAYLSRQPSARAEPPLE